MITVRWSLWRHKVLPHDVMLVQYILWPCVHLSVCHKPFWMLLLDVRWLDGLQCVCSGCCCAVATNTAAGDQQFVQISFTPAATAAFPAVSQPTVLVAPAVGTGTQHLPVLAAASQAVVPGSPAWLQVTSLPPVIVKQEKCAVTFSTPSTVPNLSNNR